VEVGGHVICLFPDSVDYLFIPNISGSPTYYRKRKFTVGSTQKEIKVEICSACHPFFTGNEKVIDSAGRVEKFKARREAASKKTKSKVKK